MGKVRQAPALERFFYICSPALYTHWDRGAIYIHGLFQIALKKKKKNDMRFISLSSFFLWAHVKTEFPSCDFSLEVG